MRHEPVCVDRRQSGPNEQYRYDGPDVKTVATAPSFYLEREFEGFVGSRF